MKSFIYISILFLCGLSAKAQTYSSDVFSVPDANNPIYTGNAAADTFTVYGKLNVRNTSSHTTGVLRLRNTTVTAGLQHFISTGSPESTITANPGDFCLASNGKAYIKATGTGNTGWSELGSGSADGNGIYTGDGTAPSDVDVTVTDNIDFDGGTLFIGGTENAVGVGTTTPAASPYTDVKLAVVGGSLRVAASTAPRIYFADNSETTDFKVWEFLNYQKNFSISRLNDANSVRTTAFHIDGQTYGVGIGTTSPTAWLHLGGNKSMASWFTEGVHFNSDNATFTNSSTSASGTALTSVFNSFGRPTLAATNSSVTTTTAATVYVENSPAAGTNQTITKALSIWVDAGDVQFDANVYAGKLGIAGTSTPVAHIDVSGGFSAAAWGLNGIASRFASATFTNSSTAASGTETNAAFHTFAQPTLAATNSNVTTNTAATVYIENAPAPGTNQSIENSYALIVDNGPVRLDGPTTTGALDFLNSASTSIRVGGIMKDFYTDVSNSGTSETDIYTFTTAASTLSATGQKLNANYTLAFSDATATVQTKVLFAGTTIFDSGALTILSTGQCEVTVRIIRTGSSTARATVKFFNPAGNSAAAQMQVTETDLTGITWTNTNIIKITGTAGGGGASTGDITGKHGEIFYFPAGAN